MISNIRDAVARNLSTAAASSLQSCHDVLLKLHIIYEMEVLSGISQKPTDGKKLVALLDTMDKRLAVMGSYISDKQYLLSIRRAVMAVSEYVKLHARLQPLLTMFAASILQRWI